MCMMSPGAKAKLSDERVEAAQVPSPVRTEASEEAGLSAVDFYLNMAIP
jgi:hypothetical protein